MGTNFYFHTKEKASRDKWFGCDEYEITDSPEFGYLIHLAKTSAGWFPLFQAHRKISSVADIKSVYENGGFKIVDEYGDEYDWPAFKKRVIDFANGWDDACSHLKYEDCGYPYFKDADGYEFTWRGFC